MRSAADAAKRAQELSPGLTREERLLVEARYHETPGALADPRDIYATLWRSFPDETEYGLALARTQAASGQGPTALAVLAGLHAIVSCATSDDGGATFSVPQATPTMATKTR